MRKSGRGGRSDPEKVCLYLLIQHGMKELHLVEAIPATESHDDGLALLLTETESLCVAWLVGWPLFFFDLPRFPPKEKYVTR